MKHIKVFEDYSEEELRALQDDLHGIGHKTKFVQGEDFGFDRNFRGENTGTNMLYITPEIFELLIKRGDLEKGGPNRIGWTFKDPKKLEADERLKGSLFLKTLDKKLYTFSMPFRTYSPKKSRDIYNRIIKKLGEIRI